MPKQNQNPIPINPEVVAAIKAVSSGGEIAASNAVLESKKGKS